MSEIPVRQVSWVHELMAVVVKVVLMKGGPGVQVRRLAMHQMTPSGSTRAMLYCARLPILS
ncbi:hypothetical protein E2C01_098725 [Portunus trituberculatus]|uniref:Uncharacterized protein n=1 Tax=Portunus trituberculatus TaxID=210409 RepID=A0A5B7K8F2_PORTR|nr:hypothetical protein [Portunus trituberculatus]